MIFSLDQPIDKINLVAGKIMLKEPFQFDQIDLLDWARWRLRVFSDFDLARELKTSPSAISKIRRGHQAVGAAILLRILDLTDVRFRELPILIERSKLHWK
ncbi:Cro/C1-type helix-turn-helix domain [Oxalobacteraceae bacterium]|jgi:transcriptional regulator with XRE-family HTH domain|nr:helix-turn-helix domain-containing protein [Oxalobacteraceae bacterium]